MNKSERINDMLLFLNGKNFFNLKELMERYSISKSTALRDVEALERIGMPIYSQNGRNGYYGVLRNRLLSPIIFNIDEVFALYFSMLTLQAYESTPCHLSIEQLKKKFENCLASEKINMLRRVERVFSLATIQHNNHCQFLNVILEYALEEKVCIVTYTKNDCSTDYPIQFFNISSSYGQWYATGYNFETNSPKVFRCDKITVLTENNQYQAKPLDEFIQAEQTIYKLNGATHFEVEVSEKGADLFYKEHYTSMKFHVKNCRYFVRGFYNKGEEEFIANYFIAYGKHILSIKPACLKNLILEQLQFLTKCIDDI
ncbi:MAG: helix-turn-helix transcriptional regulator [Filifactoraceae bacterium]